MTIKNLERLGICTHLRYLDTPYGDFQAVKTWLRLLQVKHIRDGGSLNDHVLFAKIIELGESGYRFTFVVDPLDGWTPENLVEGIAPIAPYLAAIEGANEPDIFNASFFPYGTRSHHRQLFDIWDASEFAPIPFLAPSMGMAFDSHILGQLPCDFGNMHPYPDQKPLLVNADWRWRWIENARKISDGRSIVITETGYHTYLLSEEKQALYLKSLLKQLLLLPEIARVFVYELLDEFETATQEARWGIIRHNMIRKPSYYEFRYRLYY